MDRDRFLTEQAKHLLFNSDIKDFLLKSNGGEAESLILFFSSWSALIVGGWLVVACIRNSCLGLVGSSNIPENVLKQVLIHQFQHKFHLVKGIYKNRGVCFSLLIALAKSLERKWTILSPSFFGQLSISQRVSLIDLIDDFFFLFLM